MSFAIKPKIKPKITKAKKKKQSTEREQDECWCLKKRIDGARRREGGRGRKIEKNVVKLKNVVHVKDSAEVLKRKKETKKTTR